MLNGEMQTFLYHTHIYAQFLKKKSTDIFSAFLFHRKKFSQSN